MSSILISFEVLHLFSHRWWLPAWNKRLDKTSKPFQHIFIFNGRVVPLGVETTDPYSENKNNIVYVISFLLIIRPWKDQHLYKAKSQLYVSKHWTSRFMQTVWAWKKFWNHDERDLSRLLLMEWNYKEIIVSELIVRI